jgi:uncharacterized damage-inducible protein DinB
MRRDALEPKFSSPPTNPAGEFVAESQVSDARRAELIKVVEEAPQELASAVDGLNDQQLGEKYRNWSIRQIAYHLADSHLHSYIRCKWALTEEEPLIKAYDENRWAELPDVQSGDLEAPLEMMAGVHRCWVKLLRSMDAADFQRSFRHPETGKAIVLIDALTYYAWHCRHHTAQIRWLRQSRGW